tara:strand:- start:622 stop:897 length:276 start_codon:yes stop_codon:yes gene_type:complete
MPGREATKKKVKKLKPVVEDASKARSSNDALQFTVQKDIEEHKKIKETEIFDGVKKTPKKAAPKRKGPPPKKKGPTKVKVKKEPAPTELIA